LKLSAEHEPIRWVRGKSGHIEAFSAPESGRSRDEDQAAKFQSIRFVRIFTGSEIRAKIPWKTQQIWMEIPFKTVSSSNDTCVSF